MLKSKEDCFLCGRKAQTTFKAEKIGVGLEETVYIIFVFLFNMVNFRVLCYFFSFFFSFFCCISNVDSLIEGLNNFRI